MKSYSMKDFKSSQIHPAIIEYLAGIEITKPTEIQAKTIPILLNHEGDFVGRSATGTGKTFAFGAPLLSRVDTQKGTVQAVVLVPTRELCEQVGKELAALGAGIDGLNIEAIYGGVALKTQIQGLSNGVHVVVATPGRLMDLVNRKVIDLSALKFVVFDEADEMLLKGFSTDIDQILATSNRSYSSWLFSATMPSEVNTIIKKYLNKSLERILLGPKNATNEGITHQIVELTAEEKQNVLLHFLTRFGDQKGLIFCRTKSGVQKLYKQLSAAKFSSAALHGDLPQGLRNKVMEQFREGHINILIATDVAARGVDIDDIAFVIQYHLPDTKEAYTHRSGRTSRAGKTGTNITFVFPEEKEKLEELKAIMKVEFEHLPVPGIKDQLLNNAILWGRKIATAKPVHDKLTDEEKQAFKNELNHMSKDEILEKLLANHLREIQD